MQDGTLIKDIFNRLENKYPYANSYNRRKSDYIISLIQEIEKYCINYHKWPIEISHYKTKEEELSNRLARWLVSTGYTRSHENFKYADLSDSNGNLIVDTLDYLYDKYYRHQETKEEYLVSIVSDIIKYCQSFNEWPTAVKHPTTPKEKLGNKLCAWLHKSHFYVPDKFKYPDIYYIKNITIQSILNLYCATYGNSIRARSDSYYTKLALELKDDIMFLIYSCLIKLFQASLSYEKYLKITQKLQDLIIQYNIPIELQDFISLSSHSTIERTIIFEQKYHQYSLANDNSLAYLYHLLYAASLTSKPEVTR